MTAALGWGALAASSLVIGAVLGLAGRWPERLVGLVLAFGAGALISAVSFDLAEEGGRIGGPVSVGVGLAVGAMREAGRRPGAIRRLWALIAGACALATGVGFVLADSTGGHLQAAIDGFAAGALLVMLIDSMIPEATRKGGQAAGLVTVLGFAVAFALS